MGISLSFLPVPAVQNVRIREKPCIYWVEQRADIKFIPYGLNRGVRKYFLSRPGVLINNNRMEEKLKIVMRGRKLSHFYKTPTGADVANVHISLIATADQAQENVFDYLQALQKNQKHVKVNPGAWLLWSYRKTRESLEQNMQHYRTGSDSSQD